MIPQIQMTSTPIIEYTPPNPISINIIIGLGVLMIIVILVGVWLNKIHL